MSAFLRKYGTGTGADVYIPLVTAGGTDTNPTWTPAAGDVKVSKDGGAAANIGTLPTSVTMGNSKTWKFVFSDAELQCKLLAVTVSDSATKAVEDTQFNVETYGHASALHPFDLATATQSVNVSQISGDTTAADTLELFAEALDQSTGQLDSGSFASGAIDAAALAADAGNEIADAILLRNVSNVEGTAGEHTLCTLILAGLEFSISGTTWTIKRTDGSTTHATKTLTTNASAEPVTGVA